MTERTFDFTPDPRVLIALTQTPMSPFDAVCELIDNAIDSFNSAKIKGVTVQDPMIIIELPTRKDVANNIGVFRIRDNGTGMSADDAEKAIKAGYSGNNPYDSLGLFGMGFNISTGKIGRTTKLLTATPGDSFYTETIIDLERISNTRNYQLPAKSITKFEGFHQGTIIEVMNWWPPGTPNHGFVKKLVEYGINKITDEIGRKYATILRKNEVRIFINNQRCVPYEHCVWDSSRYVERKGQRIPARYDIDKVIGSKRRCGECRAIIPDHNSSCPACNSTSIRTIEERIKGWVGIQRFDSNTDYGIDLIRNGRAIRIAEKRAFFEYVDEFQKVIKDYPIDQQYGRIIGEITLDFVPVDFLKQDFQRSSDEWQKAIEYLRGNSSLQPTQPGADQNDSLIFKLYQGYRKVRIFGKGDMYMGYWDEVDESAKRISREIEKDYYQKFKEQIRGYYDDEEWWKLVEEASIKPIDKLINCPHCNAQNIKYAEVCFNCGHIFSGKNCLNPECNTIIPKSATSCPTCGTSQIIISRSPWICEVCGKTNSSEATSCAKCNSVRGEPNPLSQSRLLEVSYKIDELSSSDFKILLSNGEQSNSIDINTYLTKEPLISLNTRKKLPLLTFKELGKIEIFIDKSHPLFRNCGVQIEELISTEVALFIYETHRNLSSYKEHNLSTLSWQILEQLWLERVEFNSDNFSSDAQAIVSLIKQKITQSLFEKREFIFENLPSEVYVELSISLIKKGFTIENVLLTKETGEFFTYLPDDYVMELFISYPEAFFDDNVWRESYEKLNKAFSEPELILFSKNKVKLQYKNSLDTLLLFLKNYEDDLGKVKSALIHLTKKMV
jgi:RNA polymerase subunit RPABC4/transcription elongation factor Spt4